ncbi:MAG: PIN domain-containing protein [Thermomicrobiales bacterium]
MQNRGFIDTNIFVNHIQGTHPEHGPASSALIDRLVAGEIDAWITETVAFETIYILERSFAIPRAIVGPVLVELLMLPNLHCRDKGLLLDTLDFWVRETPLSCADCYHLLYARHLGLTQIYTFDRKMNRLPGVTRVEP